MTIAADNLKELMSALDRQIGLAELRPTGDELASASVWMLAQDVSEVFRLTLKDFLQKHSYGTIADLF
jgi:hypothetical protein